MISSKTLYFGMATSSGSFGRLDRLGHLASSSLGAPFLYIKHSFGLFLGGGFVDWALVEVL